MSEREWKPGDVARIGWRFTSGTERAICIGQQWVTESGIHVGTNHVTEVRPLAVIDPEDEDQVKRLYVLLAGAEWTETAKVLREFANPTPPPEAVEPTGLGAVVEDAEGQRFVRWAASHRADRHWKGESGGDYRSWSAVQAVRVLSRGVS